MLTKFILAIVLQYIYVKSLCSLSQTYTEPCVNYSLIKMRNKINRWDSAVFKCRKQHLCTTYITAINIWVLQFPFVGSCLINDSISFLIISPFIFSIYFWLNLQRLYISKDSSTSTSISTSILLVCDCP